MPTDRERQLECVIADLTNECKEFHKELEHWKQAAKESLKHLESYKEELKKLQEEKHELEVALSESRDDVDEMLSALNKQGLVWDDENFMYIKK